MLRPGSLAAAALLLGVPAYAQNKTGEIDKIFSWATADTPGCAVGVSQRGKAVVNRAYGLADIERRLPLAPGSVFDIGSTQKQFVAAAVLLLVEDGRLALSDEVRKHVPQLPDYGRKVTIDHLLTHTSGIRDWTGLRPFAEGDADVLSLIVRQRGLNFAPGDEWAYSNSGFVLLKEIVARASGMTFADFARKRLFQPLGMKSSEYVADMREGSGNVVPAYEKEGAGWKKDMLLGNARGGGALLSTTGDLLRWNDALTSGRLGAFVTRKLQEPTKLNNGRKLSYARGLVVDSYRGGPLVSHSGGAAGYSSWLGRLPARGLSVAVLCNGNPVSATALARRVADQFLPPASADVGEISTLPAVGGGAAVAGPDVNGRAGLFFSDRGEPVRLVANEDRLRVAGGPSLVVVAGDRFRNPRGDLFFRSQDEFELRFVTNDELELKSMEGQTTRYRRARPQMPSAGELQALDGRYHSEDLGSTFEILPAKDGLVMRFERSPEKALEINPVEKDTYMRSMMTVRFRRDGSGKVVGFDYGNPLVRGIAFTRLGDRTAGAPTAAAPSVPASAAPTAPVSASPRLEGLAGEYELAPGRILAVTLEDGRLFGQPPGGGPKRPLTHVSDATFSAGDSGVTLAFTLGADGRATAVVMRQNGRERTLPKVR